MVVPFLVMGAVVVVRVVVPFFENATVKATDVLSL